MTEPRTLAPHDGGWLLIEDGRIVGVDVAHNDDGDDNDDDDDEDDDSGGGGGGGGDCAVNPALHLRLGGALFVQSVELATAALVSSGGLCHPQSEWRDAACWAGLVGAISRDESVNAARRRLASLSVSVNQSQRYFAPCVGRVSFLWCSLSRRQRAFIPSPRERSHAARKKRQRPPRRIVLRPQLPAARATHRNTFLLHCEPRNSTSIIIRNK